MRPLEARDFDPSRFEAPVFDNCPTCDRSLMRLVDFPAVKISEVKRLPIPEDVSEEGLQAMTTAEADVFLATLETLAAGDSLIARGGIKPPLREYDPGIWGADCGGLLPQYVYSIASGEHGEAILAAMTPFVSGDRVRYTQVGTPIAEIRYQGLVRRSERVENFPSDE
jgi:hypothetical protein